MVRKEFSFKSSSGLADIYACVWLDDERKNYRGIVQLAHGMSEHILRYEGFAVFLAKYGYIACGNDHLGHGKSLINGVKGYFGENEGGLFACREDMLYLNAFVRKLFPSLPCVIMGHSMGSILAESCLNALELNGAVLLGSAALPKAFCSLLVSLAKAEVAALGASARADKLFNLFIPLLNLKCPERKTDYDWICSYEKTVENFLRDPNCGFPYTCGGFRDLFTLMERTADWSDDVEKNLPLLILSGDDDPIGEFGAGIRRLHNNLTQKGFTNVDGELYKGMRHELLNEKNNAAVYRKILGWLCDVM